MQEQEIRIFNSVIMLLNNHHKLYRKTTQKSTDMLDDKVLQVQG